MLDCDKRVLWLRLIIKLKDKLSSKLNQAIQTEWYVLCKASFAKNRVIIPAYHELANLSIEL